MAGPRLPKVKRKKQAAGWRVYKSAQPDPQGNVVFLFWIDPTVPDADYTLTRVLLDIFTRDEATAIWATVKDAWQSIALFNFELIANLGAAPAGMNELNLEK